MDIHPHKKLIKTAFRAFCKPFGKDEALFTKIGEKKLNLYLNLLDAKDLITEETPFSLHENVTENKGIYMKKNGISLRYTFIH